MREESDGRFYYDFNQGARYVIHSHRTEEKELMLIEIGGMQVTKGGEELYLIVSERKDVRDYLGEWTKMQLALYLEMTFGQGLVLRQPPALTQGWVAVLCL